MLKISNNLIRSAKISMGMIGTVVVGACFGLGLYTKIEATNNKNFINSSIATAGDKVVGVKNQIESIGTTATTTIDELKTQSTTVINTAKSEIQTQTQTLTTVKTQLQAEKKKLEDELNKYESGTNGQIPENGETNQYTEQYKEAIRLYDQMILQVDAINNQVQPIVDDLDMYSQQILNAINVEEVKGYINEAINVADKYLKIVTDNMSKITPVQVDFYYDKISFILLTIGSVVLGLILAGTLISFIFYKKVDGKLVGRMTAKKELERHLKKILKKYPNLIEEFKRGY